MKLLKTAALIATTFFSLQSFAEDCMWTFTGMSSTETSLTTNVSCYSDDGMVATKDMNLTFATGQTTCDLDVLHPEYVNRGNCISPSIRKKGTYCSTVWSSVDTEPQACGSTDWSCQEARSRWCTYHDGEMINNVCFADHEVCTTIE